MNDTIRPCIKCSVNNDIYYESILESIGNLTKVFCDNDNLYSMTLILAVDMISKFISLGVAMLLVGRLHCTRSMPVCAVM